MKVIIITYLMMSRVYYVKSEVEKNKGYTDIMILQKPGIF
ncbi:PD-(D/E)XK nuclease domain-containing protein [Herbivorax sp. ANBcel31]